MTEANKETLPVISPSGGCSPPSGSLSPESTRTPSTSCWWTSSLWIISGTGTPTTAPPGWWPEKPTLRCPPGTVSSPKYQQTVKSFSLVRGVLSSLLEEESKDLSRKTVATQNPILHLFPRLTRKSGLVKVHNTKLLDVGGWCYILMVQDASSRSAGEQLEHTLWQWACVSTCGACQSQDKSGGTKTGSLVLRRNFIPIISSCKNRRRFLFVWSKVRLEDLPPEY